MIKFVLWLRDALFLLLVATGLTILFCKVYEWLTAV